VDSRTIDPLDHAAPSRRFKNENDVNSAAKVRRATAAQALPLSKKAFAF